MAKKYFQFGIDSRLKLLVYQEAISKPDTVYSFDGRYHKTGKIRLTDDPRHWCEENARRYLQAVFRDKYAHISQIKYVAIADATYPKIGIIKLVHDKNGWVLPQQYRAQLHQQHIQVQQMPKLYSFRLAVPHFDGKWKNFYTNIPSTGRAMMDLLSQLRGYMALNVKIQPIGQVYGKPQGQFSTDEREVPRFCWVDIKNGCLPKYHNTQRVIADYADIQTAYQNFEQMISNI